MYFNSSGIQEYVEAVSFLHYIRHRCLISLEEINARLVFMNTEKADPKVKSQRTDWTLTIYEVFFKPQKVLKRTMWHSGKYILPLSWYQTLFGSESVYKNKT